MEFPDLELHVDVRGSLFRWPRVGDGSAGIYWDIFA